MRTIKTITHSKFREKGSKFLGHLFPIDSEEAFNKQLQNIQSQFPDATHHCYGWRLYPNNIKEFAQDDGEPSGTAGLPILNQLKSFDMVNCGCIVVRYYGGTNLGTSGLINAYGKAAKRCLSKASLLQLVPTANFKISYPYNQQTHIDQLKNQFDLKEIDAQYLEEITLKMACRSKQADDFLSALKQLTHKGIEAELLGRGFITMQS